MLQFGLCRIVSAVVSYIVSLLWCHTLWKKNVKADSTTSTCKDYILGFGSEANKCFVGILGGIRVWKSRHSLSASLCSPDRLWQRELHANRLDNKCLRQPYKLRMTYDEVLWSERQDRKYQDLICVRLAMMVMNSCGWTRCQGLKIHAVKILHVDSKHTVLSLIYCWRIS